MNNEYDIIMYRKVFLMRKLTASERLVYSYLIGQAVLKEVGFTVLSWADSHAKIKIDDLESEPWREFDAISDARIGKHTSLTRMGAYKARMGLISKGLIRGGKIYAPYETIANGFLYVMTETNLTGELLLFYTWYCYYCSKHDYIDYTCEEKIAKFYGVSYYTIRHYMQRFEKLGLVKRTRTEENPYGYVTLKYKMENM